MATFNSTQYANTVAVPAVMNDACDEHGRVRVAAFTYTQSGAGADGDNVLLAKLPGGNVRVLQISVTYSAFGASRTLKVGHTGYTTIANASVAASTTAFLASTSIATAGTTSSTVTSKWTTRTGMTISGLVEGGTLPDAATISGYILYSLD
jgi:hypothetical protein